MPFRRIVFYIITAVVTSAMAVGIAHDLTRDDEDQYPFAANKHARYLWHERIGQNQYVALVQIDINVCVYWLSEYPIDSRVALAVLPARCPEAERSKQ